MNARTDCRTAAAVRRKPAWIAWRSILGILTIAVAATFSSCKGQTEFSNAIEIAQESYGQDWPFTRNSGLLICESSGAISFQSGDDRFALNKEATAAGMWKDVSEIRERDTSGSLIPLDAVITDAMPLCDPNWTPDDD